MLDPCAPLIPLVTCPLAPKCPAPIMKTTPKIMTAMINPMASPFEISLKSVDSILNPFS